jgi:uncharacterized protein YyaL (SSP411 family)
MNLPALAWLPWSTDAFQRAHAGGRPLLLSIVARWSAACREMDVAVFARADVIAAIATHAVPVRVDADQRPDIADRYGLGGWPTTVWLTPDGEMLSGGTYLDADTLVRTLQDVAARFQRDRAALVQHAAAARAHRRVRRAAPGDVAASAITPAADADDATARAGNDADAGDDAEARAQTLEAIRDAIVREFDPEHGGFGRDAKFPLAAPILFALRAGVLTSDPDLLLVADTTLDRIADSALSDPRDGAFHRACAQRDWTDPDTARLLDVQADMIALYLEAYRLRHHDRHRTRALAALRYVDETLRERLESGARGAFYHSEPLAPDDDPLIVTESNARMMRTLVQASHTLDDTRWILAAVDAAERLLPIVYVRASGVAHCLRRRGREDRGARTDAATTPALAALRGPAGREQPHVFGLLADTIAIAAALLDLGEAAGQQVYLELAEELTRSCVRRFWDADAGGFIDRLRTAAGAGDVGLLADPLKPFAANVEAARLLARLGERTRDPLFAARARETRGYLATVAAGEGILAAEYGLLLLESGRPAPDAA